MFHLSNHLFFKRNNLLLCAQTGQGTEKPFLYPFLRYSCWQPSATEGLKEPRGVRKSTHATLGRPPLEHGQSHLMLWHLASPWIAPQGNFVGKRGDSQGNMGKKNGNRPQTPQKAIGPLTMMPWQMSPSLPAVPGAGKHSRLIVQNTDLSRASFSPFFLMY